MSRYRSIIDELKVADSDSDSDDEARLSIARHPPTARPATDGAARSSDRSDEPMPSRPPGPSAPQPHCQAPLFAKQPPVVIEQDAIMCPLCNREIAVGAGKEPDVVVSQHIDSGCRAYLAPPAKHGASAAPMGHEHPSHEQDGAAKEAELQRSARAELLQAAAALAPPPQSTAVVPSEPLQHRLSEETGDERRSASASVASITPSSQEAPPAQQEQRTGEVDVKCTSGEPKFIVEGAPASASLEAATDATTPPPHAVEGECPPPSTATVGCQLLPVNAVEATPGHSDADEAVADSSPQRTIADGPSATAATLPDYFDERGLAEDEAAGAMGIRVVRSHSVQSHADDAAVHLAGGCGGTTRAMLLNVESASTAGRPSPSASLQHAALDAAAMEPFSLPRAATEAAHRQTPRSQLGERHSDAATPRSTLRSWDWKKGVWDRPKCSRGWVPLVHADPAALSRELHDAIESGYLLFQPVIDSASAQRVVTEGDPHERLYKKGLRHARYADHARQQLAKELTFKPAISAHSRQLVQKHACAAERAKRLEEEEEQIDARLSELREAQRRVSIERLEERNHMSIFEKLYPKPKASKPVGPVVLRFDELPAALASNKSPRHASPKAPVARRWK